MKRHLLTLALMAASGSLAAAQSIYVTPEVTTTESAGGTTLSPASIYRYAPPGTYTLELTIPGSPALGGIHRMDAPGDWLFSVEEPSDLAGALGGGFATPRDVIRFGGGVYSLFLCGAAVGIPEDSRIDALVQAGGDTSGVFLSFDVPTTVGPATYSPADLAAFMRVGPGCGDWVPGAAVVTGAPISTNVLDADLMLGTTLLSLDVPTTLGGVDYTPGQIVASTGMGFSVFTTFAGWPMNGVIAGFSIPANPGRIPPTLMLARSMATPGNLTLSWSTSCSQGGDNYAIYEGTIGAWYNHTMIDCLDNPPALTEEVTPAGGSTYYLVVPHNGLEEGSYGTSSTGAERPAGAATCVPAQSITPCPP